MEMVMDQTPTIEERLRRIEERNHKVSADKAWETSWFRILTIAAITYVVALVLLSALHADRVFLSACVPVAGYILSTQSLPMLKRWWITARFHK
jgi:hypothetical protein